MTIEALYSARIGTTIVTQGGAFNALRPDGSRHKGRDVRAARGTRLYAAGDNGVVTSIRRNDSVYGQLVTTAYQRNGHTISVMCAHMFKIDYRLYVGMPVGLWTWLGESGGDAGTTGAGVSTFAHLHESVWVDGVLVDPENYLNDRPSTVPAGETGEEIMALDNADKDWLRICVRQELGAMFNGNTVQLSSKNPDTGAPVVTNPGGFITSTWEAAQATFRLVQGLPAAIDTVLDDEFAGIPASVDAALADNFAAIVIPTPGTGGSATIDWAPVFAKIEELKSSIPHDVRQELASHLIGE